MPTFTITETAEPAVARTSALSGTAITSIRIPDSVTIIGQNAFANCSSLSDVVLGSSVNTIDAGAFQACEALTTVTVPDSVTTIGADAFDNMTLLGSEESAAETYAESHATTTFEISACTSGTGHTWSVSVVNPTCSAKGYTHHTCETCGVSYQDAETEPNPDIHTWNSGTISVPATCTEAGVRTLTCTGCSETTEASIPALEHDYIKETVAATCTEGGYTEYTCSRCQDSCQVNQTAAMGHSFTDYQSDSNATCTRDSTKTASCARDCGATDTVTEIGSKLGHAYQASETVASTCQERGYITYTCTRCGNHYNAVQPLLSHTEGDPVTENRVEPTTATPGFYDSVVYCAVCGQELSRIRYSIDPIARIDLSDCEITLGMDTYTYDGQEKTPEVIVSCGDSDLTQDQDYVVLYKNNQNAGTATVSIVGIGNYTGTATSSFTIKKADQTVNASISSTSVQVGKTATISASGKGTLSFRSSNTNVATVSNTGVVTGIKSGSTVITVTAAGDENHNAAFGQITITVKEAFPTISKLENVNGGVKITWGKVSGAAKYRLFVRVGSAWKTVADTTGTSATFKGISALSLKSGTSYQITARCNISEAKSYTSSYDTTGKAITYIAAPTITALESVNGGVKITWGKVNGAVKYRVFRKTGTGSWQKVGDTTATTYTDKTAQSGVTYRYTIRCINSAGTSYTSGYNSTGKTIT